MKYCLDQLILKGYDSGYIHYFMICYFITLPMNKWELDYNKKQEAEAIAHVNRLLPL